MRVGLARLLVVLALALSLACLGVGRKPVGEVHLPADAPYRGAAFSNALYQTVGVRLEGGNRVEWVNNGRVFEAAIAEIAKAKKTVRPSPWMTYPLEAWFQSASTK